MKFRLPAGCARLERRIRPRMQDLPVQEKVDQLSARLGKLGMFIELMRNSGESVQLAGYSGVTQ